MPDVTTLKTPPPEPFACPTCGARYKLVRVVAEGVSLSHQRLCRACGGPLKGREGRFVLKYKAEPTNDDDPQFERFIEAARKRDMAESLEDFAARYESVPPPKQKPKP